MAKGCDKIFFIELSLIVHIPQKIIIIIILMYDLKTYIFEKIYYFDSTINFSSVICQIYHNISLAICKRKKTNVNI